MKIYQLIHTLSYGDAISNEALVLDRLFKESGFESKIYAINEHPKLKEKTIKYQEFPEDFDGCIILHYSLGSPLNSLYKKLNSAKKFLIYHNLTPAKWFKSINPRVARDIEKGQEELPDLLKISDKIISDSEFNSKEIEKLRFSSFVLSLPFDPVRWEEPANAGIATMLDNNSTHILHVGRIAPNKCLEDLIKTFYCYHEYINKDCFLWLPGIDIDTEVYSYSLKRLVNFLGLEEKVRFVGCFADSEIKALYENATCYLCMSEHEGFCLPIVEAMYFNLPVVSYSGSALADTVGNGGVLFSEKNYLKIALLIEKIAKNADFKSELVKLGQKRIEDFSIQKFKDNALSLFNSEHVLSAANE